MINYGQWQTTPDYREGLGNTHQAAFGGILRALDPATYVPGLNTVANFAHDVGDSAVTQVNTALSPIVGGLQKYTELTTPGLKQLNKIVPWQQGADEFVRNKPFDAAALAAATYFSGGQASKLAGAAGAPAASTIGGTGGLASAGAAGTEALTPAFAGGASVANGAGVGAAGSTTGGLVGASSITPALTYGGAGGVAGASGLGTLGTAGTAAANSALTPSFASLGGGGVLQSARPALNRLKQVNQYRSNFRAASGNQQQQQQDYSLGDQLLNDNNNVNNNVGRVANTIHRIRGFR